MSISTNEKNCDNCKKNNTYFDCSQCSDFDEWEQLTMIDYKNGETLKASYTHIPLLTTENYTKTDKFKVLQEQELEMYALKNAKYGDSFGISVKKYGLISALTRMSDKFNRIETLILSCDNGTDDESLIDSLQDLSNYANMTIIELEDNPCN